ncbi:MAG: Ig-like domain-containing protein, partial [Eubacterium sp.]|nr:Ig-like domain-containing protein [Eubacterium sp.]
MKKTKKRSVFCSVFLSVLFATIFAFLFSNNNIHTDAATSTVGLDTTYHTQDEIRNYIKNHPVNNPPVKFDETPSAVSPYSLGKVSDESLNDALNYLNCYRYISGVNPVTISDESQELAQAAALILAANRSLSHSPTKPSGMSDSLYSKCLRGCANSNIAGGSDYITDTIDRYMLEINGDANYGHRRQLLDYDMTTTGFGCAISSSGGSYGATYIDANLRENKVVSYPGTNQPLEFFGTGYMWTIIVPQKVDSSSIKITIKDVKKNKTWTFTEAASDGFLRLDTGYNTTCVMLYPNDILYRNGDKYQVNITGIPTPISYEVNMFYGKDVVPVESVNIPYGTSVYVDKPGVESSYSTATLTAKVQPSNASNPIVNWTSSDDSIAYPVFNGSNSCKIVGVKPGTVTFTATTEEGGFTDTVSVSV